MMFRLVIAVIAAISALTVACAHRTARPPEDMDLAFPHGTYQHRVLVRPNGAPSFEVTGVMESRPQSLRLIGLSPLGTTAFRIHEDFSTGKIEREIYLESLKSQEKNFGAIYDLVKTALFAPKGRSEFRRHGAAVVIADAGPFGVPHFAEIQHPRVSMKIEVTGYAP